jgi:hypothetical protein
VNAAGALVIAAALFSYALVLHVVTWRLRPPPKYLYWFLKHWLLLPLAVVGTFLAIEGLRGELLASQFLAGLGGFLTYLALCAGFILIYPAISMSSLSLEILHHLRRHGPQREDALCLADRSGTAMLESRRDNLVHSGMFEAAGGDKLVLTAKGRFVASVIDAVRWALAIPRGSGG